MKIKSLKLPAIIIAIGLLLAVAACLVANVVKTPVITEQDFQYSVTYKLNGEIKTVEGIYKCKYNGYGDSPRDRYYTGEYTVDGQTTQAHTYTIAEKDGAEIYIITLFNDCYLMNDTKDPDYEPFLEDPQLEALDREEIPYDETNMPKEFTAEILSWEYPEPIENTFVFGGFSLLHVDSMNAMLVVGLLTLLACLIFVKKDKTVSPKALDRVSVVFSYIIGFGAIPFITLATALMQITMSGDEFVYQLFLCVPAVTALTVAAAISLRRKGFTKSGFILQFVGPMLFFVPVLLEALTSNILG